MKEFEEFEVFEEFEEFEETAKEIGPDFKQKTSSAKGWRLAVPKSGLVRLLELLQLLELLELLRI
jgi:hypothetical protein